jgi:hypothetical protein
MHPAIPCAGAGSRRIPHAARHPGRRFDPILRGAGFQVRSELAWATFRCESLSWAVSAMHAARSFGRRWSS